MAGNGGIIGPVNTVTNGCAACGVASGVWQMGTVYNFVKNSNWVYNFATADYMVVAGGGAGTAQHQPAGANGGSGGGGGGMVSSYCNACAAALTTRWGSVPVTVGGGGTATDAQPQTGVQGTDSVFFNNYC